MEFNSLAICRKCHDDWGRGISMPHNNAIDRLWGEGTAERIDVIAKKYPQSKGTYLDCVDFRLELEAHYKQKLELLQQGVSVDEIKTAVWKDFGLDKENVFDDDEI